MNKQKKLAKQNTPLYKRVPTLNLVDYFYCEYENLKRCEDDVMSAGFIFKFPRTPEDDACIVETYMR